MTGANFPMRLAQLPPCLGSHTAPVAQRPAIPSLTVTTTTPAFSPLPTVLVPSLPQAVPAMSQELRSMQQDLAAVLDDVLNARARAVKKSEERARRDQELRDDAAGHTERLKRLTNMLNGAVSELHDEVYELKQEHADLDAELQKVVQRVNNDMRGDSHHRAAHVQKMQEQVVQCEQRLEDVEVCRQREIEALRQEVFITLENQAQQEDEALVQGTKFVNEVNFALQLEGQERASQDVVIKESTGTIEIEMEALALQIAAIERALEQEAIARQAERTGESRELQEVVSAISLAHRNVEHIQRQRDNNGATPRNFSASVRQPQEKVFTPRGIVRVSRVPTQGGSVVSAVSGISLRSSSTSAASRQVSQSGSVAMPVAKGPQRSPPLVMQAIR